MDTSSDIRQRWLDEERSVRRPHDVTCGTGFTTLELKINFIRALTTATGPV
jgi:hypothetical protein